MLAKIIILNYNNSTDTKYCISSILKYSPKEKIKLLIVDNGSEENIREELHIFLNQTYSSYKRIKDGNDNNNLKDITYLCLQENCGYARGNNAGIKFLCQFESITHIMILNNDIIFTEDVITPLLEVMPSLPDAGTISPLLYKPTKEIDYCCARKNYPINTLKYTFSYLFANKYKKLNNRLKIIQQDPSLIQHPYVEIELPSGSCMMFEKNTIHQIEGFDPNTFLYYEESILYKRLKAYGKRNYLIPSVSCIHIVALRQASKLHIS